MKATIRDSEVLRSVKLFEVIAYLRSRGWSESKRLEQGSFWTKVGDEGSYEILLPSGAQSAGYIYRISEALATLEESEGRSQLDIIEDIGFSYADVIRPRLLGGNEDGTISIEAGKAAYEQARTLMLAAACAAIRPQPVFTKRKPDLAMDYLRHARFGKAQRGSYILTIISPVNPRLVVNRDLFGYDIDEEPFERKIVRTLAQAIDSLSLAGRRTAASGDFEPIFKAVSAGVSANLCEALVGLNDCSGEQGLEFRFSWCPGRATPVNVKSCISVESGLMPILREAARIFREATSEDEVDVFGTVHRLKHEDGNSGSVTVKGAVDGIPRTVTMRLSGWEHALAVRSYEDRIPIACSGVLKKEGRSWVLKEPRGVSLSELGNDELEEL